MTQTIVHFVFTLSGKSNLVRALRESGRKDQVVTTWHDLNLGPIDPFDPSARAIWLEKELGRTEPESRVSSERDWDDALFPDHRKIVWLSRRSAHEYCGFLNWLWQSGDAPFDIIDLSEVLISTSPERGPPRLPVLAPCLAHLRDDNIRLNKLWELAAPLPTNRREQYLDVWRQLISENAPLRVIENGMLVSAEASYFDSQLMELATDDWQRVSRIIGMAMASELNDEIVSIDFEWMKQRLMLLVERGQLEILEKRSRDEMHLGQVRLARTR
ncbi:DUF3658 domain-containing protein [Bradyrhizobium sp. JYMT SZCCT0428]|uniref:DUF3658 domain-containing protein n=1 Tax=Bradyrhizobium sp. JYMT SZCCT0428 TaxID=2807673 RepID=UPI001BA59F79|nr:DUF3658 domain-containing protein [Bradyrhizobium sp. JYMT SZCCT0428]MBR1149716.1 DUF1835 domain-containing protein [Bradyrhizobium sp. JYMT SZCCT0428]